MKGLFFKGIAVALMMAATTTTISAQPQRGGAERPQRGGADSVKVERTERAERVAKSTDEVAKELTEKMTEKLGLTAAQVKKVAAANLDFVTKMEESRKSPEAYKTAVVEILTPEQVVKYMRAATQQGGQRGEQRGGQQRAQQGGQQGRGAQIMAKRPDSEKAEKAERPAKPEAKSTEKIAKAMNEKMVKQLSLSDEQAAKLYKINLDMVTKRQEAKELPTKYQETIVALLKPAQIVEFMKSKAMIGGQKGGQKGGKRGPQMQQRGGQKGPQKGGQEGGQKKDDKKGAPKGPQKGGKKPATEAAAE
ncbi:MAG: hypothetical protein R3Y16_02975 [Rikenellaceae bacterium]